MLHALARCRPHQPRRPPASRPGCPVSPAYAGGSVGGVARTPGSGLTFTTEKGYVMQRPEVIISRNERRRLLDAAVQLGLTPAVRARIPVTPPDPADELEEFLRERRERRDERRTE